MTALPDVPRSPESDVDVLADLLSYPPVPPVPSLQDAPAWDTREDAGGGVRVATGVRRAARVRGAALRAGGPLVVAGLALRLLPVSTPHLVPVVATAASVLGLSLLLLATVLAAASPAADVPAQPLAVPLDGDWATLSQVSGTAAGHGTASYGQAFALDLAHREPGDEDAVSAERGTGLLGRLGLRRPEEFGSYGQPVFAVADATVVRVVDGVRDHRSRTSGPARAYAAVEGAVRELWSTRAVLGNHVVLDLGEGRYAVCAHLQSDSILVEVGDRVLPGGEIAACGSSGATTRPHLHLQLMASPRPLTAAGLPFTLVEG